MSAQEYNQYLSDNHVGIINTVDDIVFSSRRDSRTVFTGETDDSEFKITSNMIEQYRRTVDPNTGAYNLGRFYKNGPYKDNYKDYLDTPNEDSDNMNRIRATLGLDRSDLQRRNMFQMKIGAYNRYKLPFANDCLKKTFAHVFFVRPNLNLFNDDGTINENVIRDPFFFQQYKKNHELFTQLSQNREAWDPGHQFMMFLSAVKSFQLSDEYIGTGSYGTTVNGHKIAYGQSDIESQVAETINMEFTDDQDLNFYFLHKIWSKYISNVYTGRFSPRQESIFNKELDYATSCYYFLCGEDGETILFWSKYYGVFPITIPSSQFSYQYGQILSAPTIDIKYQYSWKRDTDPLSLVEFNMNAFNDDSRDPDWSASYTPSFDPNIGRSGPTWVGPPFVELVEDEISGNYIYKLRFRSFPDLFKANATG